MKKYTIIYSHNVGSACVVKVDCIETDDIVTFIKRPEYNGCVNFIFDGWVKSTI